MSRPTRVWSLVARRVGEPGGAVLRWQGRDPFESSTEIDRAVPARYSLRAHPAHPALAEPAERPVAADVLGIAGLQGSTRHTVVMSVATPAVVPPATSR